MSKRFSRMSELDEILARTAEYLKRDKMGISEYERDIVAKQIEHEVIRSRAQFGVADGLIAESQRVFETIRVIDSITGDYDADKFKLAQLPDTLRVEFEKQYVESAYARLDVLLASPPSLDRAVEIEQIGRRLNDQSVIDLSVYALDEAAESEKRQVEQRLSLLFSNIARTNNFADDLDTLDKIISIAERAHDESTLSFAWGIVDAILTASSSAEGCEGVQVLQKVAEGLILRATFASREEACKFVRSVPGGQDIFALYCNDEFGVEVYVAGSDIIEDKHGDHH